jgi:hypothetical protein
MTRTASLKLIQSTLTSGVCKEIVFAVERSLAENRSEERKEFVSEKVRTIIGDILAEARNDLRGYPLAFNPDLFFPVYQAPHGGERFILVDQIWMGVEPSYRKGASLQERTEEARLKISNVLKDHVAQINIEIQTRRASGEFRDPSSTTAKILPDKERQPTRFLTPRPG